MTSFEEAFKQSSNPVFSQPHDPTFNQSQEAPALAVGALSPSRPAQIIDSVGEKVCLKLLVTNNVAGSLIGKKGATIGELQSTSGARIKLSQSNDFFPGTHDRIVLLLGELGNVKRAQALVLEKVFQDQKNASRNHLSVHSSTDGFPSTTQDPNTTMQSRFVIPSKSAGVLIGQGGANIKELHEKSGARIQLHARNAPGEGSVVQDVLKERMVTVIGTLTSCIEAINLSLSKLVDEHTIENPAGTMKYQNMTTSYSRLMQSQLLSNVGFNIGGGSMMQLGPMQGQQGQFPMYSNPQASFFSGYDASRRAGGQTPIQPVGANFSGPTGPSHQTVTLQIPVHDAMIGAILGRGGARLTELQQTSGARISISQRGEFIPGTQNRTVTIVGSQQQAQTAEIMIQQKLQEAHTHHNSSHSPFTLGNNDAAHVQHAQQVQQHAQLNPHHAQQHAHHATLAQHNSVHLQTNGVGWGP